MWFVMILIVLSMLSWRLTGAVRQYALRSQLVDIPNDRSSHTTITPSGGGLAITLVFLLGIIVLAITHEIDISLAIGFIGGGCMLAVVGYIDDRRSISPMTRIVVHAAGTVWLLVFIQGKPTIRLDGLWLEVDWLIYPLEIVGVIWCINLFNFMDGIDGLAGGQALFVGLAGGALFLIADYKEFGRLPWIMAAASAGFVAWNRPPARIFMGDVGSGFLGFVIAGLVVTSIHHTNIPLMCWFILMGVFVVDSTATLLRRFLRGEKWYDAHRSHAYQHATQKYKSHLHVTLSVMFINVFWLLPLSIVAWLNQDHTIILGSLTILPILVLAMYFRAGAKDYRAT